MSQTLLPLERRLPHLSFGFPRVALEILSPLHSLGPEGDEAVQLGLL